MLICYRLGLQLRIRKIDPGGKLFGPGIRAFVGEGAGLGDIVCGLLLEGLNLGFGGGVRFNQVRLQRDKAVLAPIVGFFLFVTLRSHGHKQLDHEA